ncbi:MAG: hypothetical protein WCR29_01035 [Bacteroidales bacterium]
MKILKVKKFEKGYKPSLLTKIILIICIITYTLLISINTFIGLFNTYAQDLINSPNLPNYMYFYRLKILEIISYSPFYFIVIAIIQTFILLSFVTLHRGFTTGYYSYLIAQTCAIIIPILVMGKQAIAIGDIMISIFLIVYLFIELIRNQTKSEKIKVKIN